MTQKRLDRDTREKQLLLALHRIRQGRAHTKVKKVTFANVAREAGVSTALIHNSYARTVGEAIRKAQGRTAKEKTDALKARLQTITQELKRVRSELALAKKQMRMLASINEGLSREVQVLGANSTRVTRMDLRREP